VDEEVALGESVGDEAEGLLEMGSHAVRGDVKGADGLVIDAVVPLVAHAQHGRRGEHCVETDVPERMFFCRSSERSDAA
jgi:hypothetical protein